MSALSRRTFAAILAAAPMWQPSVLAQPPDPQPSVDDRLSVLVERLAGLEVEFAALPEDHPRLGVVVESMDNAVCQAAMIQPATDRGYAVKAWMAQRYGDGPAGAMLTEALLCDLMDRAG